METLLVKIFATALALSQVAMAPEAVSTHFDRVADQGAVAQLLRAGCAHMRKAFDIEDQSAFDIGSPANSSTETFVPGGERRGGCKGGITRTCAATGDMLFSSTTD
jgi:hypothetical protein